MSEGSAMREKLMSENFLERKDVLLLFYYHVLFNSMDNIRKFVLRTLGHENIGGLSRAECSTAFTPNE